MKQYVARRSLTRGAAQARRLIAASQGPAKSVITSTTKLIPEQAAKGSIQYRRATIEFGRGGLIIHQGESFFLVESAKFAGRFYLLVEREGHWMSSSDDARVTDQLVARIEAYQASLAA